MDGRESGEAIGMDKAGRGVEKQAGVCCATPPPPGATMATFDDDETRTKPKRNNDRLMPTTVLVLRFVVGLCDALTALVHTFSKSFQNFKNPAANRRLLLPPKQVADAILATIGPALSELSVRSPRCAYSHSIDRFHTPIQQTRRQSGRQLRLAAASGPAAPQHRLTCPRRDCPRRAPRRTSHTYSASRHSRM